MSNRLELKVLLLNEHAKLPEYQTGGASGADLCAAFEGPPIQLEPGKRITVPTGLALEFPHGTEAQVRSRSGLASGHGVIVLNSPGTIDRDYRGEVMVVLFNTSETSFAIRSGDRIAQLVVCPVLQVTVHLSTELEASVRGKSGIGSTGL